MVVRYRPSMSFTELTKTEKEIAKRLAEIEQDDADVCASCGGEDCICCEIYHDRKAWVEPEELFSDRSWEFEPIVYGEYEE